MRVLQAIGAKLVLFLQHVSGVARTQSIPGREFSRGTREELPNPAEHRLYAYAKDGYDNQFPTAPASLSRVAG